MFVLKRDGNKERVSFDKVLKRIDILSSDLSINSHEIAQKVCSRIYDGVSTDKLDELAAYICSSLIVDNPDYDKLASRIVVSNHQKKTKNIFSETVEYLYNNDKNQLVSDELYAIVQKYKTELNDTIKYERDYYFDYFGFKTLEKSYLLGFEDNLIERPQDLFMRVAIGIHGDDIERIIETYNCLSNKYFVHATPTLFNFGTKRQQGSSCFVAGTPVFTVNRGPVPIEEVRVGDKVVTHTGSFKSVIQTHKNPIDDRTLFDIKVYKTPGFKVTDNHRFWSLTKEQLEWKESPQWNSIKHLRVGDWISIPKSNTKTVYQQIDMYEILKEVCGVSYWTYSFDFDGNMMRRNTNYASDNQSGITIKGEWFKRYITVDENFAWFLGSWYGNGSILFGRGSEKYDCMETQRGIAFSQNPNNTEFIDEIVKIGEKYLGIHASICTQKKHPCLSVSFNNSAIGNAFNILFERWSSEKFLWPAAYSWSREMVVALIGGLVSSDSCCCMVLQLTNQPLIQSLFHLTRSVGLDTSMTIMTEYIDSRAQLIGSMNIPWIPEIMKWVKKHYDDILQNERLSETLNINGNIFLRINSKTKVTENIPSYVYTLGVEDDHSYSVGGLIAENCFLLHMESDSVDGMYNTLHDCAMISKYAGGIGLHIHNVRAKGSMIRGTNGVSSGIIPMLRVFNNTARHVNQAGKRNGSIAIYLETWHADIESLLDMKKNHGNEEERARDLFYAMWISDLFMKRVKENAKWSLMCPDECPGLSDVYGQAFEELYQKYENEGRFKKQVEAQHIWYKILDSQIETGTPYMLYKDSVNMKTNHQNLGTIKSSNLCCEIMEYTAPDEIAVCNLASLCLPSYIKPATDTDAEKVYDFELLREMVKIVTRNLNKVIDRNFYPNDKAEKSNMKHRPIGIGVQGLADTYILMGLAYESPEADKLNKQIFETIYYASLEASMELSKERALDQNVEELMNEYEKSSLKEFKGAYSSYEGSPVSNGVLQYDMWNETPSDLWDWAKLKKDIKSFGIRNSLLVAPMPTASTAQIMGFTESFEPITTNIYKRKTIAGEFIIANKYLVRDLIALGLWDKSMKEKLIINNGSIQSIENIPADIKIKYKTVWEIKQKSIINQAADRGAYICQSQSMNLFIENPTYSKLTNMHFYAWSKGLKTGIYYLRTKAKAQIQQFSIDPTKTKANFEDDTNNPPECLECGA